MKVLTFCPKETFGSNMYLLISSNECAVIDPSVSYQKIEHYIDINNLKVKYIFVTHSHFDHILEINEWKTHTNAKVIVGKHEAFALSDSLYNGYSLFMGIKEGYFGDYIAVNDGDTLYLADENIQVIDTPGHSIGGISFLTDNKIFVGDVIFASDLHGRTDLPGGDYITLINSIKKIQSLPHETAVYPGHGKDFKIQEIKM